MSNQDDATLRQRLESMIVRELEEKLKSGEITGGRAKEVANIVLEAVPKDISHDELLKIIPQLDNKASELAGVVYQILSEKDEEERNKKMENLRNAIRSLQNG